MDSVLLINRTEQPPPLPPRTLTPQAHVLRAGSCIGRPCHRVAPTARPARPSIAVRAAQSGSDVPPNVAEARAWIAAWRAKHQQTSKAPATSPNGNGNGQSSHNGVVAPAATVAAPQMLKDGSMIFSAEALQAKNYNDFKLN